LLNLKIHKKKNKFETTELWSA